jgi:chromosome segregation ATPase
MMPPVETSSIAPVDDRPPPGHLGGRGADARRVASAGLADLAARRAEAIAALDRALEARLGELDRALAVRRSSIESLLADSEARVGDLLDGAVTELRRSGTGERRSLHEAVAAELAGVEALVTEYRHQLHELAALHQASVRRLEERVAALERAVGDAGARPGGHGGRVTEG